MFTGIVSGIGRIARVEPIGSDPPESGPHGVRLTVFAPAGYLDDARPGDSIAVQGACMTLTDFDAAASCFSVDVSAESLSKTAGLDAPGPVNLEQALRMGERLGGHLVSGHVDGVGTVTHFAPVGESHELRVLAPAALGRFLAVKGSIALAGVSLTVNHLVDRDDGCEVSVNVIPHTLRCTTLGELSPGRRVNIEVDLIARQLERLMRRV